MSFGHDDDDMTEVNYKMDELERLVLNHRFTLNKMRTNIGGKVGYFGTRRKPFLIKGVYSNSVKNGRMLELVQGMLPDAGITELCLNRNVVCIPHKDKGNYGPSWILFIGTFQGGGLCFETGERYEQTGIWHGPFFGAEVTHWNEPITSGTKYAVVAYSRLK